MYSTVEHLQLDEIEYSLGLNRGDIKKYCSSNLLKAEGQSPLLPHLSCLFSASPVHSDMVQLFQRGQWTLVPPVETLQAMHDLFDANHVNGTHNRTGFLDVCFALAVSPSRSPVAFR